MKHFGKMILSAVLAAGLMALPVYADNGVVGPTGAAAAETVSAEVGTAPAAEGAAEAGKVTATSGTTGTATDGPAAAAGAAVTTAGSSAAAVTAESSPAAAGASAAAVQGTGTAGTASPKVVTNSLFGGGELMLIASREASQNESFLITTKSGKHIMVDSGLPGDAEHLKQVLRERGGHVDVWLITHPHSDHVGALIGILNDPASGITIDSVYYNFAPIEWYWANEEYRAQMVVDCMAALSSLSPSVNHPNIQKGDVIDVDDVRITVMNSPYLFQTNAINNSSVAYREGLNGRRILFLGDMAVPAGNSLLNEYRNDPGQLRAEIVQMAHHGEHGVDEKVYQAIAPHICLWCCPAWLWDNDNGGGVNSGPWTTMETRAWMRNLKVRTHVVAKDGDQILR